MTAKEKRVPWKTPEPKPVGKYDTRNTTTGISGFLQTLQDIVADEDTPKHCTSVKGIDKPVYVNQELEWYFWSATKLILGASKVNGAITMKNDFNLNLLATQSFPVSLLNGGIYVDAGKFYIRL